MTKQLKSLAPLLIAVALFLIIKNWWRVDLLLEPIPAVDIDASQVTLYSTSWCGYCAKTRDLLQQAKIPFNEYDIEQSTRAYQQYQQLGGRGVPVVAIGEQVIHGFKPSAMRQALRQFQ